MSRNKPQPGPKLPRYEPQDDKQRLAYFIEECGEVLAAMGKTLRWGVHSYNPELAESERESNGAWLRRELMDLLAAIDRLPITWLGVHELHESMVPSAPSLLVQRVGQLIAAAGAMMVCLQSGTAPWQLLLGEPMPSHVRAIHATLAWLEGHGV